MFMLIFTMTMLTVIAMAIGFILPEIMYRRDEKYIKKIKNKIKREDQILHDLTACQED